MKGAALSFLYAASSVGVIVGQSGSGSLSEVPYYGRSPPVYPSPIGNGSTSARWAIAYSHAHALVSQMTVEEMANVTRGWAGACAGNTGEVPRLGIPALCFSDAPDSVRGQEFVSAFPAGIHLAATFDKDLMYRYGRALGDEYHGKGINIALGPVAGPLGRVVRGGRNWEGLSNDPYLAGVGMGAVTRGIQDAGVIATPKHWLLNEQEFRRRWSSVGHAISANVDDRALHELYVFPFMDALREGAGSVMCSYQRANHSYACQNSKLLNGILKTELGFEGFVVSDWDGQMSGVASANAGMDLVMPNAGYWGANLTQAVRNGSVSDDRISDMATRILAAWYYLHQDKGFPPRAVYSNTQRHPVVDVRDDHATLIEKIGAAGTVLVKNVNNTLPFKKPRFLCVYGYGATLSASPWQNPARYGGGYEVNFRWNTLNGTLITGGGSGGSSPPYVVSPFQALQERVTKDKGILRWDFWSANPAATPYVNADACLVFINAYASESFDRVSLTDEFSDQLVLNVAGMCANTIVVVHSTGIRVVDAWISHPNVTAVLFAGLPGQESGHSLVSVLYGVVNPSGRLPYTVAKKESDYGESVLNSTVSFDQFPDQDFSEGLYIDYRAFDRNKTIEPRFEFGFGLSYTTFAYSTFKASLVNDEKLGEFPDGKVAVVQGGHPDLWETVAVVTCTVANTGKVHGTEVVQLYVGIPPPARGEERDTPVRQLRGIERVGPLAPGQEDDQVIFRLTRRDLSVWDVVAQQWRLRRGEYMLWIGASSRDLRLDGSLVIT
ncbi:glycosyl hydrolase family 3 N terminal domain-containing protein [Apodospora peruviana]|uniref:Beta-glucosidase cel3A n=1 Tax=Apodospora peruviana TaxID=516989 RepID=A0AAE0M2D5_9PEZI|nr:glycosyl hydrolase family 3 N terminal domain-containing protein [Apodospora peruviana]